MNTWKRNQLSTLENAINSNNSYSFSSLAHRISRRPLPNEPLGIKWSAQVADKFDYWPDFCWEKSIPKPYIFNTSQYLKMYLFIMKTCRNTQREYNSERAHDGIFNVSLNPSAYMTEYSPWISSSCHIWVCMSCNEFTWFPMIPNDISKTYRTLPPQRSFEVWKIKTEPMTFPWNGPYQLLLGYP